ncbi:MAG: class I SAM-dependent methyltransferase [Helicobacteraceae bacterium]|jgi:SAM-dependent methyltransferase|nr:class I SAM-dependent methyltransferase [Helicobacteraceae bacterium]
MNSTLAYYAENAQDFFDNTCDKEMRGIYQKFLPLIAHQGTILDAGCGSGRDTLYFLSEGYKVDAFDASKEMAALASRYIKQEVRCQTFEDIKEVDRYDAVWAAASLLHLPFSRLSTTIEQIAKALKTNGIFYASFKYGEQEYSKDGRHFTPLNVEKAKALFKEIDTLHLLDIWLSDDVRQDRKGEMWLNLLGKKILHDDS